MLDSIEIFKLIESIKINEIQELISQSFYNEIQSMHLPYDLELIRDSIKIDTLQFLIPWFKKPVLCAQSIAMNYNKENIEIQLFFNYLIDKEDYENSNLSELLDEFSLILKINYTLDYSSKWIKSISSESIRKENDKVYIERQKITIYNSM